MQGNTGFQKDLVTERIIGAALVVHKALGPGLLESAYEACLARELFASGVRVARQVEVPIVYRGMRVDLAYRADLVVEDTVIVEVKAVNRVEPIVEAQLLTYLKLLGFRRGLICNFNVTLLRDGLRRLVV